VLIIEDFIKAAFPSSHSVDPSLDYDATFSYFFYHFVRYHARAGLVVSETVNVVVSGVVRTASSASHAIAQPRSTFLTRMRSYAKLANAVSSRGVKSNPYTTFTVEDIKCEIDNVQQIAKQKKPYLESLLAFKKFKGAFVG